MKSDYKHLHLCTEPVKVLFWIRSFLCSRIEQYGFRKKNRLSSQKHSGNLLAFSGIMLYNGDSKSSGCR